MEIRGKTIPYSCYKNKQRNTQEKTLLNQIKQVEENVISLNKGKSRSKWIENGEKNK